MKNLRKFTALFVAALALCLFASCSNGSDSGSSAPAVTTEGTNTGGGGTNTTPTAPETTPTANPVIYTITFNANDGTKNPDTVPQNFTAGVPQALTLVEELGFSKDGFYFAGWGTAPKSKKASYADGANYTATAPATLYALWSEIIFYSVNIPANENGGVTSTLVTAAAGTEITLSNAPNTGYQFASYSVTDADGTAVTVTDGKFTMPANNVTVTANFTAIDYNIAINPVTNGDVVAAISGSTTPTTTANYGQTVILTATPQSDYYRFDTLTVTAADGANINLEGSGNTRTFVMPAQNVTISATFESKKTITIPDSFDGGTVAADKTAAFAGETVNFTATPQSDSYRLSAMVVTAADGTNVTLEGSGNTRSFAMLAQNVTISAVFESKKTITIPDSFEGGTVTADKTAAFAGEIVTFTATPGTGLQLATLTLTDSNGTSVSVGETGNIRTFTMPAKNVTVTATFEEIPAASGEYTKIGSTTIAGVKYDLVTFGLWPQTRKAANVTVDESKTKKVGEFTYYKGSDGQWYAKVSDKYYKVEPIKWTAITPDYSGKGIVSLLADDILIKKKYDYNSNNYQYSDIRKWLNSNTGTNETSDYNSSGGFLKTAFSVAERSKIVETKVYNGESTCEVDASGHNDYASETRTTDKIFLTSVSTMEYARYRYSDGSARIRKTTDFAYPNSNGGPYNWWLRSPYWQDYFWASCVRMDGTINYAKVSTNEFGIVPSLRVEN